MISIQKYFGSDNTFFDLLEGSAEEGLASARVLNRMVQGEIKPTLEEFSLSRRKDKQLTREIGERLVKALVTSLEREDIEALSTSLYKVPKSIEKFAERYIILSRLVADVNFTRQTHLLEQATAQVVAMVKSLRKGPNLEEIKNMNNQLQQMEGDADKLMLELIADLYSGRHEPMKIIALKDLYEILEKVIDRCRDAGNAVNQIALKHS
jgi:uncharacterized protein Yka (UPF0111/DUF47 family)